MQINKYLHIKKIKHKMSPFARLIWRHIVPPAASLTHVGVENHLNMAWRTKGGIHGSGITLSDVPRERMRVLSSYSPLHAVEYLPRTLPNLFLNKAITLDKYSDIKWYYNIKLKELRGKGDNILFSLSTCRNVFIQIMEPHKEYGSKGAW